MQKVFISIPNCIRKVKFVTFSKVICLLLLLLYFSKPGATIDNISQGEGRLVILYMLRQKMFWMTRFWQKEKKSRMVWFEITMEHDHITGRRRASHCVPQAPSSPRLALPPSSWLLYRLSSMWSATTITITTTTITTTMTTTITTTTWTSMKMMQQCECECGYDKFMHFE